jgi:hypothetical protein
MPALFGRAVPSTAFLTITILAASAVGNCGGGGGGASGTGGTSGSGDAVALCKQTCDTYISLCLADAGALATTAKGICEGACANTASNSCTNASAIASAYRACLTQTTCAGIMSCQQNAPTCVGGAGTGGAAGGGTGGASGGGTGGASGGTGCADLLACCNAATNATVKSLCMTNYNNVAAMGDAVCASALAAIKSTACP